MALDIEEMICAAQHIKTFHKQCAKEEIADWGEPCSDCINISTCNMDWLAKLKPLFEGSGVPIRICYQENEEPVNKDSLKETMDKFNENKQNFICIEALKIFCRTQSEEIALRALELLYSAWQSL